MMDPDAIVGRAIVVGWIILILLILTGVIE